MTYQYVKHDSAGHSCDSCGYLITNADRLVHVCTVCDHYVMCNNCGYWAGMHVCHQNNIVKVPIEEYLGT